MTTTVHCRKVIDWLFSCISIQVVFCLECSTANHHISLQLSPFSYTTSSHTLWDPTTYLSYPCIIYIHQVIFITRLILMSHETVWINLYARIFIKTLNDGLWILSLLSVEETLKLILRATENVSVLCGLLCMKTGSRMQFASYIHLHNRLEGNAAIITIGTCSCRHCMHV